MEKVFITSKEKALEILGNEEIKRFGEAKYYEARVLGIKREGVVLFVKGGEKLLESEIFEGLEELEGEEKERVLEKIKEMEESAASGVGMIFG